MSYSEQIQEHTTPRYLYLIYLLQLKLHLDLLCLSPFPSASLQALLTPRAPAPWHPSLLGMGCCECLSNPRELVTSSSNLGFIVYSKAGCFVLLKNEKRQEGLPGIRKPALRPALSRGLSYSFKNNLLIKVEEGTGPVSQDLKFLENRSFG